MDAKKIEGIVQMYKDKLVHNKIPSRRMNTSKAFQDTDRDERLMHAHYLCENIHTFLHDEEKWGKVNRHFTAIQMCLSYAGWYTLDELMGHNKPL